MGDERPLRADAARNRARILQIAEEVVSERGFEVPVSVIAAEAGVGVGTVYRHFPTKEALFGAILTDKIGQVREYVESLAESDDPAAAFREYLNGIVDWTMRDRSIYKGLAEVSGTDLHALADGLRRAEARLLGHAQAAGGVRADLTPSDLKSIMMGCVVMVEHGTPLERAVQLATEGLGPR
ncbi:TetR/AcrR family transcriptional regulator [Glycomyces salinus]|uniref:TetR/AcrR family transcriptional regulator n=1 Tax=Glycomyces salinus TaxID=980294 RepID=UPI0018EB76AF|nr:TetR/AcrR family transcriptional regulator [Glycomyces salinus]